MPPLSWNEIRSRAIEFSQNWQDATSESAEKQSFWNDFFNVFGIPRRRVASFEEPVKKLGNRQGFIDLFWKGTLLVEHKSAGVNLAKAKTQALDYFPNLKNEELPRYILTSDFQHFELYDLDSGQEHKFSLAELHTKVELFGFIAGYQKREFRDQDPVNIKASELMGKLHDMLKESGYGGHDLEQYLVRLLFCLFADDTGIFEKDALRFYIEEQTREDGSDLGYHVSMLFQVLNTPPERRQRTLSEALKVFPYVNGSLFAESLPIPAFDRSMREALLTACYFDWGSISPAIFGSLFQSVMDRDRRRGIGAHYTTEKNILKILKPLFLDALYTEFESVRHDNRRLRSFHQKLESLTFLDPACGCGNFLILAYRELRRLEIEVLKALYPTGQLALDVSDLSRINVDAFYGIEIEEFPARIAEVALWLTDHQMNMRLSEAFGQYYVRIPLKKAAHIHHANALQLDWQTVIPSNQLSYILGNPPFVGSKYQSVEQREELARVFKGVSGAGNLDYVAAWYLKAAQYIQRTRIICAFVSTNSITQGEQVAVLWQELFKRYHIKIHFAHRTFAWTSEARGKAAVHCVIIGFAAFDISRKLLYEYDNIKGDSHEIVAVNITPYLTDGADIVITKRSTPLSPVPEMVFGNMPIDGGFLVLDETEKRSIEAESPEASKFIRSYIGSHELIQGVKRWCLWLIDTNPNEYRFIPSIMGRIAEVKKFRLASKRPATKDLANTPSVFGFISHQNSQFIAIPRVSSETRIYLPIVFLDAAIIPSDQISVIYSATIYHFGILTSMMHMAWMRYTGGRLKSDYRYSGGLVYNNFPWPQEVTPGQVKEIEVKAQAVLDARAQFPGSTLADLYDPLTMPPVLLKAHQALDKAVDAAYRKPPFDTERHRIEFLFGLYQQLTDPMGTALTAKPARRSRPAPRKVLKEWES